MGMASCSTDSTVHTVKEEIEEWYGIQADQQRLMYDGRQLEDGRTLAEYGITSGTTLALVLRLRGC